MQSYQKLSTNRKTITSSHRVAQVTPPGRGERRTLGVRMNSNRKTMQAAVTHPKLPTYPPAWRREAKTSFDETLEAKVKAL